MEFTINMVNGFDLPAFTFAFERTIAQYELDKPAVDTEEQARKQDILNFLGRYCYVTNASLFFNEGSIDKVVSETVNHPVIRDFLFSLSGRFFLAAGLGVPERYNAFIKNLAEALGSDKVSSTGHSLDLAITPDQLTERLFTTAQFAEYLKANRWLVALVMLNLVAPTYPEPPRVR